MAACSPNNGFSAHWLQLRAGLEPSAGGGNAGEPGRALVASAPCATLARSAQHPPAKELPPSASPALIRPPSAQTVCANSSCTALKGSRLLAAVLHVCAGAPGAAHRPWPPPRQGQVSRGEEGRQAGDACRRQAAHSSRAFGGGGATAACLCLGLLPSAPLGPAHQPPGWWGGCCCCGWRPMWGREPPGALCEKAWRGNRQPQLQPPAVGRAVGAAAHSWVTPACPPQWCTAAAPLRRST